MMKFFIVAAVVSAFLCFGAGASAQLPDDDPFSLEPAPELTPEKTPDLTPERTVEKTPERPLSAADLLTSSAPPTPDMWLYLQQTQRADDPKMIVRRNAEFRAAQRRHRIAARKWFGYSNLRPAASHTPFTGTYSPTWIGNTRDPYQWSGFGWPSVYFH